MKARLALFALATVVLAGCGGSGSNPGTTLPTPNAYAGKYESTMTLDGGKRGDLAVTVSDTGSASGTLTISAGAARDPFSFTVGEIITVSGNVDRDGSFEFSGTDPFGGTFDVTGNLPADGNGTGSVTVTAGGESYTSTIGVSVGTGSGSITFSNLNGTSISGAPFPSNPYVILSTVSAGSAILAIPSATDSSRSIGATVSSTVPVGQPVTLNGGSNAEALAIFSAGDSENRKNWIGTSGTITVVSRSATSLEVKFTNVKFEPNVNDEPGTGSFVVNGTIKK